MRAEVARGAGMLHKVCRGVILGLLTEFLHGTFVVEVIGICRMHDELLGGSGEGLR